MSKRKWPVGTIITLSDLLERGVGPLRDMGLDTCQVSIWDDGLCTADNAEKAARALEGFGAMTSIIGWPGPAKWNFIEGPITLGLLPEEYRARRMEALIREMTFVSEISIPLSCTHVGFLPEDPNNPLYGVMVDCLRRLADHAGELGHVFCLETGQETPITLRRAIEDAGAEHLGINLDTANLLLYGKANPADAVDMFGQYVRSLHVKDGEYPTDPRRLGKEMPVGQGRVDFPAVLRKLDALGFSGPLIIEREIRGPQQIEDIRSAIALLDRWMAALA
ncbi:MAG: sugar phosphate isomerase/epimerase family protein [Christensenellales bacterium]|jgi:L-ribulose-5-phosphate 3-epimerase